MPQADFDNKLLQLWENQPETVFVRYFPPGPGIPDNGAVGFSLTEGGTYHLLGIEWHNVKPSSQPRGGGYDNLAGAKILKLMLEAPIDSVKCDLYYSPKVEASPHSHMTMCIPSGNYAASYHFEVFKDDDTSNTRVHVGIDPQIVVTPITQPGM
jgi:hypothetical protein